MKFKIIGCGTGNNMLLTGEAKVAVLECDKVFSTERISTAFKGIRDDIEVVSYNNLLTSVINSGCNTVGILVGGDNGFFSASKILKTKLEKFGNIELICGISSMQYFCSKIGISYENCIFASMHGKKAGIIGLTSYNKKVFVLTGGKNFSCKDILNKLNDFNMGFLYAYIGENLSLENEKITQGTVYELKDNDYDKLSVMMIINFNAVNKNLFFYDRDFIRTDIPMTKEEIRWISISKMNIKSDFICYDIGSGTGSVSIEMAKKADKGMVYSVDKNTEAVLLLNKNIKKLGCYNIKSYNAEALSVIDDFPSPDVVFIGGSGGNLNKIIEKVIEKNANVRIVINAVLIETVSKAYECFKTLKIKNMEVITVNISKSKTAGNSTMMTANNPITIICGGGVDEA